jgi:hypothetical protein
LRRLKKAELKRLWLVAGLWDAEDGMGGDEEGEVADGLTKDVLVEGIIKAVSPAVLCDKEVIRTDIVSYGR